MIISIDELTLKLNIIIEGYSFKNFKDDVSYNKWSVEVSETASDLFDASKECALIFDAIGKTVKVISVIPDFPVMPMETWAIDTCILACDTYADDLNSIDTEFYAEDEIEEELKRLQAMYLDEMTGNDFPAQYLLKAHSKHLVDSSV